MVEPWLPSRCAEGVPVINSRAMTAQQAFSPNACWVDAAAGNTPTCRNKLVTTQHQAGKAALEREELTDILVNT